MVHFRDDDLSEVVAEIDRIAESGGGHEWLTISPWVNPEDLPVVSVLRRLMSGRGPKVPELTWVPPQGGDPAQLGILHSTGPDALHRVKDEGVSIPERWRTVSDHSKRGLLFAVHPDTTAREVVEVALDLARALAAVPTDDRWVAEVSKSR